MFFYYFKGYGGGVCGYSLWGGYMLYGGWGRYGRGIDNEVCIVFLGKIGSGKSVMGNIILNGDFFEFIIVGLFVMLWCISRYV